MFNGIEDPGDYFDDIKWDFEEDLPEYTIDNYTYLASNYKNALILHKLRGDINRLCKNLISDFGSYDDYSDNVDLFLEIHDEYYYNPDELPHNFFARIKNNGKTSRYLLSEIPHGTPFDGINKPRLRYNQYDLPKIGKDGTGRALYRHIFLNLNKKYDDLIKLLIHELAHTMANHIRWRRDDHGIDFITCENIIKSHW